MRIAIVGTEYVGMTPYILQKMPAMPYNKWM